MTKVNFKACFDAKFEYDKEKFLKIDGNEEFILDDEGNKIPETIIEIVNKKDDNGEVILDENEKPITEPIVVNKTDKDGNVIYKTKKLSAKEIIEKLLTETETLKDASYSKIIADTDNGIHEIEINLLDFANDVEYKTVENAGKQFIETVYSKYTNTRGYTVGKYIAGNSFGVKIVIVVF